MWVTSLVPSVLLTDMWWAGRVLLCLLQGQLILSVVVECVMQNEYKTLPSWQHPNVEAFSSQTSVQVSEVPNDDSEAGIGAIGQAFFEAV